MQAGSTFWRPLDRRDYGEFIEQWLPVCRTALGHKLV
jgi:hypothetical protein